MKTKFFLTIFIICSFFAAEAQNTAPKDSKIIVSRLMDSLWINPSSFINHDDHNWIRLNQHLENVDILQLNELVHSIYFGKSSFLLNKSHANEGFIGTLNRTADSKKLKEFHKKIRNGFRDTKKYPDNKIVLVEGDSWFEYPVFLKDISDNLEKQPNLALYTIAEGSDWISNMISNFQYEYVYKKIKPDVFLISGGGNDFVGDARLSAFIRRNPMPDNHMFLKNYRDYVVLRLSNKNVSICGVNYCKMDSYDYKDSVPIYKNSVDTSLVNQIVTGRRYLNKNFYRFMATMKLEYKILFESLRKLDPVLFKSLTIVTQGYDYAIPSFHKRFGLRMLMDNGEWLKEPLMISGIIDPSIQQSVIKTMIFEINEMLIELGREYDNVYHVDSRGITAYYASVHHKKPEKYWYDELHPKSKIFKIISEAYTDVINGNLAPGQKVVSVVEHYKKSGK